ncbi:BED-type domain-containing protein [Citrus sinensis]|nr:BED-type domain-containing protein [Citrus sinensis]
MGSVKGLTEKPGSQQQRASSDSSSIQPASTISHPPSSSSSKSATDSSSSSISHRPATQQGSNSISRVSSSASHPPAQPRDSSHPTAQPRDSSHPTAQPRDYLKFKAKCNNCGTVLSCGSGTSHLNRHTRQIHGFNQPTIEEVFENKQHLVKTESGELGIQKFDPLVARQKLTTVVVKHELPLRFVEYESFRDFVDYCNPLVKHMSRNTLKSEIFKIYNIEKGKAMNLLEITNSRVAITTDMWTACNQKKGYMVVTGHFIDNSWHLQNRILRFIYVQAPHTADCISQILVKCLMDWNLDRKLSTVTLDNCSTNDAMVARLKGLLSTESMIWSGNFFHMSGIIRVRDSVSYWSSSPKRVEKFELACRQIQIDVKKLGLDCPTRWNSTFVMLELAGWQTSDVPAVKNMADNMIGKFLKYWDEISGVLVMAVILDPRYKMMLINYYYPKIYVVDLENQLKRVRELCDEMMNYYEAKSATTRYCVVGESSTVLVVPFDQSHIDFDNIDDMGDFDAYATQNSQPISSKSDLDRYLEDPLVKRTPDFDVLQWWKMNKAIHVTTVASESAFSTGGRTLSPHRSRLHPDTLEAIMCSQHWLWATSSRGGVPEEEIFAGEELKDEDEDGPQILDLFFCFYFSG